MDEEEEMKHSDSYELHSIKMGVWFLFWLILVTGL